MLKDLLVITPDVPFGELIRQSLGETGRYNIRVSAEQDIAADFVRDFNPALAFLDTALSEKALLKIGQRLRMYNPRIVFVVISETGWHEALEELCPAEYLSKPFYLPDLLEMTGKFIPSDSSPVASPNSGKFPPTPDLPWLSDVTRAAQHLTRLTLESSAQAALITRAEELWAYAGQLPQEAARELADTVSRYWDRQEENDLVRFIRLTSTNAEHMLYATRLAEGMVLSLVFDAETPFSTIRSQASQLVNSLSTSPSPETGNEPQEDYRNDDDSFTGIPTDIPAPNPHMDPSMGNGDFGLRSSPGLQGRRLVETKQAETSPASLEQTVQPETNTRKNRVRKTDSVQEGNQETQPHPVIEIARKIVLEPVSAAVYNLDYACLLVPRFTQHHLTGDLLEQLGEWVPQICIAFGWRLEYISIRPEYLQWIVNVPPATSPSSLMRSMRQHTSKRIFNDFPRFKKENPSGDFWAPGYLIMGGSQSPPAQLIKDFIAQTRQRQGSLPVFDR